MSENKLVEIKLSNSLKSAELDTHEQRMSIFEPETTKELPRVIKHFDKVFIGNFTSTVVGGNFYLRTLLWGEDLQ